MLMTNKEAEEMWKNWPDKTEEGRNKFFEETSWLPTTTGYLILVLRGTNPNDRIQS